MKREPGSDSTPIPDPDPITAKQSGLLRFAEESRGDCLRMAKRLEDRALEVSAQTGRPDLAMRRIANRLRDLAKRYERWHTPPPGVAMRTNPVERAEDRADSVTWFGEAWAALGADPPPV